MEYEFVIDFFGGIALIDYRSFRLSKLNSPEFSHLKYLLFWPLYGLVFRLLESLTLDYTYMHCALDDAIPFCEYFIVPYLFWFVYLIGMVGYTLFFDKKCFVYMMRLIIITCTAACVAYAVFPSAQDLRPVVFERNNIFTDIVRGFYEFDTNTNVCPSVHVSSSVVILMAAWNSKHFHTTPYRIAFTAATVLICLSTVFLKQHSVIDVIWGLAVCAAAEIIIRAWEMYREHKSAGEMRQKV